MSDTTYVMLQANHSELCDISCHHSDTEMTSNLKALHISIKLLGTNLLLV